MSKKSAEPKKGKKIKHARIELSEEDYAALEEVAREIGLGISPYIRMVVLKSIKAAKDENN
jgi:hypothetical protein